MGQGRREEKVKVIGTKRNLSHSWLNYSELVGYVIRRGKIWKRYGRYTTILYRYIS